RYIERNPVKAHLVDEAPAWAWSSAAAHCEGRGDAVAEGDWLGERIAGWICSWAEYLQEPDEEGFAVRMRRLENTGRPLGDRPFLERLGGLLGRDLLPKKPGPPKQS
ncbi:MAG: transposase, partial [Planctomycetes bacterium]|nr:transposase [Planctomycetota bacterium]